MNAQEPDSGSMAPADLSESNPTKETPAEAISLEATVAQDDRSKQQAQAQSRANKTIPRIPDFRIIKKLGEGTYGEVYLAEEENTGYRVAVKFLSHVFGQQWQMLQEEVRQLALLRDDPGIVQIQDANFDAQPPYYIMRYAEGGSLTRKLENGPLPVADALTIFRRMAEALAYVHAKGVRHCDLKPGNVLLDARGRALLADFGQAHLANDASPALGTFFYMAPEQADLSQQIPDTRWDVYGLGAVFYAMLAGSPPRETDSLKQELGNTQLLSHRLHRYRESIHRARRPDGHRRLPGMDLELAGILDRCLELDPAKRYRDAGQVLDALDRRERKLRQRPMLLFAGLVPLILLMVMTALGLWMLNRSFQKAQKALEAQLWESDRFTAQLVAAVVREKLHDRVAFLTTDAEEEQLKLALAKGNRAQLADLLHIMRKNHKDDFLGTRDNNVFSVCAVVDQNGHILATDVPKISQLINPDMQFRWRDWFNGQGDKADNKEHPWKPIEQTYISQPFVSTVPELGFCVNISTPIRDSGKKPLGLLVGTIKVDDFNCWLTTIKMRDGFAVMLNQRGHCLLHPSEKIKPDPGQPPFSWFENTQWEEHFRLCRDLSSQTPILDDPIDDSATKGIYYASYAPVRLETLNLLDNRFWHVLIQHDKDRALEPLKRVYRSAILFGCLAILAVGFLVAVIWLRLPWLLRLLEKKAHA